mmetsp:Transcript_3370/g.7912  ORF Transcript_3370/g.7912 Transcript_3370/m.7912 type:complete len:572 (-) Transcript_3370:1863-3578(-)|eukprot:CAMPEP_0178996294 /NCGR_PEP_ID=MMETSP0795-20121207/8295_1 /TAXON_ID=88552 /ORGANISM="Amoebophrya sp., Strain Ameob2" /LENGTH=571 /DNA_ID=CAMNT_0020688681 /DNA_START=443 /DNA_END=2158 /DNA_ORIENTATION=+
MAGVEQQRIIQRAKTQNELKSPVFSGRPAAPATDKETAEYLAYLKSATQRVLLDEAAKVDTHDYYEDHSLFARIAADSRFDNFTLFVIVLNAAWIGVDTELNSAPDITRYSTSSVCIENLFCYYFTLEVIIRFNAFKYACNCIKDFWFRFDAFLVSLMIVETWLMPVFFAGGGGLSTLAILRLLRLARLTRMVRIMRSVPELLTLIKGMVRATKSVASTLALLIIFLYVFGLVFAMQYKDFIMHNPDLEIFANIGESMFALFIGGTLLDDLTYFTNIIRGSPLPAMLLAWYLFVLLSSFTVLNMLIGVLCEVVTQTAEAEQQKMVINQVGDTMVEVFAEVDTDRSGLISQTEFELMKENDKVTAALELLAIQKSHLVALADSVFGDASGEGASREVSFTEFLEMAIHLRPENLATVLDVIELRNVIGAYKKRLENKVLDFEASVMREVFRKGVKSLEAGPSLEDYENLMEVRSNAAKATRVMQSLDNDYYATKRQLDDLKRAKEAHAMLLGRGRIARLIYKVIAVAEKISLKIFGPAIDKTQGLEEYSEQIKNKLDSRKKEEKKEGSSKSP